MPPPSKSKALFGSYLLALLLLPLASSCECTKPMAEVKNDYMHVIHPLLQNIESNISEHLRNKSCGEIKKKHVTQKCDTNNETQSIHRMVCSIPFKNPKKAMSNIKCDMWKLRVDITDSLECRCSDNVTDFNCTHPPHRTLSNERLCRMRNIIEAIKTCYAVLTEKNS